MTDGKRANHAFRPIILDPAERWRMNGFDLKFDAKWTHQPGGEISMDHDEMLTVLVHDRQQAPNSGMRFVTGEEWVHVSAGRQINVTLTTRSLTETPVPFQAVYIPQDSPPSEFFKGTATVNASTLSFDLAIPADAAAKTHFIMVEPLQDNTPLVIVDGRLKFL